jgi:formylmethanofuran dehydrogenase subunit C
MSGLRFELRDPPDMRLDLSPLVPDRLAGMDRAAIERIELGTSRMSRRVGDVFGVHTADCECIAIEGGSARFDWVGAGMRSGELVLDGEAGLYAGRQMAGGHLRISGRVGGWAASGLRDGHLEIGGDAGPFLGGPLAGERAGMAGGIVVVRGNAAERAGDCLRRGLIVIEGRAGPHPGSRMLAGTLIICGAAGASPGYLMRRGTLVLGAAKALLPTFVPAGEASGAFRRLLAGALTALSPRAARLVGRAQDRFMGDMASLGKGEILVPAPATLRFR